MLQKIDFSLDNRFRNSTTRSNVERLIHKTRSKVGKNTGHESRIVLNFLEMMGPSFSPWRPENISMISGCLSFDSSESAPACRKFEKGGKGRFLYQEENNTYHKEIETLTRQIFIHCSALTFKIFFKFNCVMHSNTNNIYY